MPTTRSMTLLRRQPHWIVFFLAVALVSIYQSLVASDRYVSAAHVVINSPYVANTSLELSSVLSGGSGNADLLLLRDHLLSVDMLHKLEAELQIRKHFSNTEIDIFSRLDDSEAPTELFHRYFLSRIEIKLDEYAHVLRIRAQAFDSTTAHAISRFLLKAGEEHMNTMGQRLASEQFQFIEKQVEALAVRVTDARELLLNFQNENGLISPLAAVERINAVVANLEVEQATQQARYTALSGTQSKASSEMIELKGQIRALKQQIGKEKSRMATQAGDALNRVAIEYETLELQSKFALNLYSNALGVLENTRVEASRQLKQISILQAPTMPEFSTRPHRVYNIAVFTLMALLAAIITHLMLLIIRDHRD